MEHLLSLSIDNLSSRSTSKIRKGLRQIEGLLAQICLSSSTFASPRKKARQPSSITEDDAIPTPLQALGADPAFLEFFRLQQTFEYNVATKLLSTLSLLCTSQPSAEAQDIMTSTLQTLHGLLLLHPPSRSLLGRQDHMTLVIDLLNPAEYSSSVICASLLVFLSALLDRPDNARSFEEADGLTHITSLLHINDGSIHSHAEDFLSFYLMPETLDPQTIKLELRVPSFDSTVGGVPLPPSTPSSRVPSVEEASTPSRRQTQHFHQRSPSKLSSTADMVGTPPSHTSTKHQRSPSKVSFIPGAIETPNTSSPLRQPHQRSPSKVSSTVRSDGSARSWGSWASLRVTRTTEEKMAFLKGYIGGDDYAFQGLGARMVTA